VHFTLQYTTKIQYTTVFRRYRKIVQTIAK
jgi:hypothetical protein